MKIFKNLSILLDIILNKYFLRKPDFSEKKIFLQGKLIEEENKKKKTIDNFQDVEFSVFSQFGEDGVISWVIDRIPNIKKVFLEIGTQDYWESNTRFLLKSRNWKGYLIDSSAHHIKKIKSQRIYWKHKLKAIQAFINKENINNIIEKNISEKEIGLLSIDIDGNDYWILEKIKNLSPAIIVCEFNSIFGDIYKLSIPYEEDFVRNEKHYSNLYFGASIQALISMLKNKDYFFLGTCSTGINAFFVKNELSPYFEKNIRHKKMFPSLVREGLNADGKLTFEDLLEGKKKIDSLEVFDFEKKEVKKFFEYKNLYSSFWKESFK